MLGINRHRVKGENREKKSRGRSRTTDVFADSEPIDCDNCGLCEVTCPAGIQISAIFALMNIAVEPESRAYAVSEYRKITEGIASDCIFCGLCESRCPHNLPVTELLQQAVTEFE